MHALLQKITITLKKYTAAAAATAASKLKRLTTLYYILEGAMVGGWVDVSQNDKNCFSALQHI